MIHFILLGEFENTIHYWDKLYSEMTNVIFLFDYIFFSEYPLLRIFCSKCDLFLRSGLQCQHTENQFVRDVSLLHTNQL